MLGNFSFGDYFKRDAIAYAWELLTEVFKLPKDKTLGHRVCPRTTRPTTSGPRKSAWRPERVIRIGDNKGARYASGQLLDDGRHRPLRPVTEIFYDHGDHIWGGPRIAEEDGDRFIEIWNNVFMQFNRDESGVMHPLPKPSVDTGMGLERISAVLQHVHANYEIDLFQA